MSKRIRQCNLQRGDDPKYPLTFGPPLPMDANVNPSQLIAKETDLANDGPSSEIDDGDTELSNMLASIETMDGDFLCTESTEIHEGCVSSNQGSM